jgi:hypothetical protein
MPAAASDTSSPGPAGPNGVGWALKVGPSLPFEPKSTRQPRRPLFVPGSAEARGAVKAARFRTAFVQLRAPSGEPAARL